MASSLDEVECQAARVMDIVDSDQQGSRSMGVDRFDESKTHKITVCRCLSATQRWLDVPPA